MDFRLSLIFLLLYFIRPQDWVQFLIGVNVVRPLMIIWTVALLTRRERSPLAGLLRTPHDWVLLTYLFYVVWNSPDSKTTFTSFFPLLVFYALTVQSLNSWDRLFKYLKMWNGMLLCLSALAVASLYGIDLTGAVDYTSKNAGRLALGTWLCNNPNALAHTVTVAIPLSYCMFFWRCGITSRSIVFPIYALLIATCVYYTQSKGAFLVAGGLMVVIFVIGRPLGVKAMTLAAASTIGLSALSFLPRMEQMGNLRGDEGVQGRLMAWELARTARDNTMTGEGWRQFVAMITWEGEIIPKATHSSYVQVGADLGRPGLFLFVAGLWCAMHSLISIHRLTRGDELWERCRRSAMILVIAYMTSSWMINREYHTEYFLIIAIAAAIHRLCQAQSSQEIVSDTAAAAATDSEENLSALSLSAQVSDGSVLPRLAIQEELEKSQPKAFWTKIGLMDALVCLGLTWCVIEVWDYVLTSL